MSLHAPSTALDQNAPEVPEGAVDPSDPSLPALAYQMLRDVEVEITLEIGRRRMRIADVLKLVPGQTLSLSKSAGEPLDLYVNGQLLGRGEAVVLGDRYGVRITELASNPSGMSGRRE